ncbi:dephospho-CoA kinase [Pediococcus stilesii]|uniref:Dephospho-CoA kinase n=1 Tax=Pediococcus stilesii TaxID=331679 RepID=A0A0R2KYL2_9LACO|nr:dephospho-CoA kinase [Pediococcus stilesii]KRN94643.1 dephospho-CoA kinase [Pediococcus stilesii]
MSVIIGLTGGIAMGKSTISNFLKKKGIKVVDADQIAHAVLNFSNVVSDIADTFGKIFLNPDGTVDRKRLGKIVFSDPDKLKRLNAIVQPQIRAEISKKIATLSSEKMVILDAPVLFEQGYEKSVDYVMVVATDEKTQISRLMQRDNLSKSDAKKRIEAQIPIEEKMKKATVVIDTSGTIEATQQQVVKWLVNKKLLQNPGEFGEVK